MGLHSRSTGADSIVINGNGMAKYAYMHMGDTRARQRREHINGR